MIYGSVQFEGTNKDHWEVVSDKSLNFWRIGFGSKVRYDGEFHHVNIALARRVAAVALLVLLAPLTIPALTIGLIAAKFSKSYAHSFHVMWQAQLPPRTDALSVVPTEVESAIIRYLDIPALLAMSKVSRHMKDLSEDDFVWMPIARELGLEVEGRAIDAVKKKYIQLMTHLKFYCMPKVPADVQENMRRFPPTIQSLQMMDEWVKARATLLVWQEAAESVREAVSIDWESGEKMIAQARGFPAWAKGQVGSLPMLLLSNQHLSYIPSEVWNFENLRKLRLSFQELHSISPHISHLKALRSLNLYANNLTELPSEIWNLDHLINLDLGNNDLTSISSQISNLTNLRFLTLYHNQISTLPIELWSLPKLQNLFLDSNLLESLSPSVSHLTQLRLLSLSYNRLTTLPTELCNLTCLTDLNLADNLLSSIPYQISNLSHLTNLTLTRNQLTTLPPQIGNLIQLETLYLNSNRLSSLPNEMGNLTSLRTLDLYDNHFRSLQCELVPLRNAIRLGSLQRSLVNLAHFWNPSQNMALSS